MSTQLLGRVPFLDLEREYRSYTGLLEAALQETIQSGQYILGSVLEGFEQEFAEFLGVRHAAGVANGQDALELILRALELEPEDEVIVPAMTFVATANAVQFAGARLVLCDVGPDGLMDPDDLRRTITPRSRVVIPVHLHGKCADMRRIGAVAAEHGLRVVEDACQAHGAEYDGRRAGCLGDAAAFSFYPTKNLGCLGDGGAVVTDDEQIHERILLLRNYGSRSKYVHDVVGRNSRLDDIQASVLRIKLGDLDARNLLRRKIAARYREGLAELPLTLPEEPPGGTHVYHVFAINLETNEDRDALRSHLQEREISTLCHYPLSLNRQPALSGFGWPPMERAEQYAATTLSLPMFALMRPEETDRVIDTVSRFWSL